MSSRGKRYTHESAGSDNSSTSGERFCDCGLKAPDKLIFDVYFRPLGFENDIGRAKEGIGSKEFMKSCQEEENMASFDCMYASCIRRVPWEHLGRVSVILVRLHAPLVRPHECKTITNFFVDRASARFTCAPARSHLTEIK
ncbi:hypothetical protein PIB30_102887 [Stylosanthes scabra]|uniref:Uncharacterized protein n=1 Tax=Stylosanthes scabra TaxID=79078 RepID=A0ABU6SY37_9FABA|nr:hypothetical protein [Stylosanthes scabra]